MTSPEFAFVLAWLLLPPLLVASAVLAALHYRSPRRKLARTMGAVLLLVCCSTLLSFVFAASGPPSLGRVFGVRDEPFMWAPFAALAVAAALPLAIWWARRGEA